MPWTSSAAELAHARQVHVLLERRLRRELASLLGHRRRVVAHPLQLVRHVIEREQEAQVAGDRLLGGDRPRDLGGHRALRLVDPAVADDHRERGLGVVVAQRGDRGADRVLDQRSHAQNIELDLALLAVERLAWWVGLARGRRAFSRREQLVELIVQRFGRGALRVGHVVRLLRRQPNRPET